MAPLSTTGFQSTCHLRPSLKSNPPCYVSVSSSMVSLVHPLSYSISSTRTLAVAEEKEQNLLVAEEDERENEGGASSGEATRNTKPCQLYVCNLPRSCDVSQLLELFSKYGTVDAVEVVRDPATGLSRGCGNVTMNSYLAGKEAISAINGTDLGGRQVLVKFTSERFSEMKRRPTTPRKPKSLVYESPYKIYIGNLAWSVLPNDLSEYFSKYGTVVSTRVMHDKKEWKHRVYAFVSFSSEEERNASVLSNGSMFQGREMSIRAISDDDKPKPTEE